MRPTTHGDGIVPSAAMRNWMAELGDRLVANGYPIIPIMPGAKCPGQFTRQHWTGYVDWTKHCSRPTRPFELGIWKGWPGCGIGVACGAIIGLDIDILEDQGLAEEIQARALAELGDTPAIRIGLAPKRLLVYRAAKPFSSLKRHPLEMLGIGSQFVAYGTHPDTGRPYSWAAGDELADIAAANLPAITEEQARAFLDSAYAIVPAHLRRSTLGPDRSAERYLAAGGDLRGTVEAITDAMRWVPNDDLHYDDWVRVGMAIKGAIGEDGAEVFAEWSARSTKNDPATTDKAWRSFKPEHIGAGTIYGYALERGWVPEADMTLNGLAAERQAEPHPAAALLAKVAAMSLAVMGHPPPAITRTNISAGIVERAPGLLGEMTRWIVRTAVSPQPLLSLGASMCAVAAVGGRRWRLVSPDTRTSLYIIALAESGGGKDHPRKCVRRALIDAGLGRYLGGETLASGSALISAVAAHPSRLFQIDEFGHFVAAVLDPKSHAHHRREIMTQLTTLWSSAGEVVIGTEYANQKERPRVDLIEPCVCVYGSTVPMTFWRTMHTGTVSDGSLARFLVFQADENFPDEQRPASLEDGLAEIARKLKALAPSDPMASVPNIAPKTLIVPMSSAAEQIDDDLRAEHLELKRQHEGTQFSAIVARYREHIRRVALVAAVADGGGECAASHVEWARDLVRHCLDTMLDQAERFIADSEHEALLKKVLDIIRRAGRIDGTTLAKRTQFLRTKERMELLLQLEEAGQVVLHREKSKLGRPGYVVEGVSS